MATVEQTMMKVQRLLTGPMGLKVTVGADGFQVGFKDVSTVINIRVKDWGTNGEGDPETLVLLWAPILQGVRPSPELFEWVAREGGKKWFGHIEVHNEGDSGLVLLVMSHTLLGDFLDERELEAAFKTLLLSADTLDDELQKQFGGKRWADD